MKKRLRFLAWLITLTMLCQLLPFGAFAQSDIGQSLAQAVAQNLEEENGEAVAAGKCGDSLTWSLSSDGTLTISGTGDMYDYSSDGIGGIPAPPWISHADSISKILIDEGVTSIGSHAFVWCKNVDYFYLPNGLTSIGADAFYGCSSAVSIVLPDTLSCIGSHAFEGFSGLTSIDIPDSITLSLIHI